VRRGESFVEEDTRFHYLVAQAARNELVLRMLHVIMDVLHASREEWLQSPERARASLAGHRALLAAIERHDADAARDASADHVHHVGAGLITLIQKKAQGS
jgi:GntR family transcriptional repressor for pyruvate dehydrogenase complex